MINDRLARLSDYPFARLNALIGDLTPPADCPPIIMSIGEPRHAPPAMVAEILTANAADWGRYPPTRGTDAFRKAVAAWLTRRYALPQGMIEPDHHILPCAGTREALFTVALLAVPETADGKPPTVLMPNPFYQVYAGAAILAGAEPVYVAASAETGFLPDFESVPPDILARAVLAYLCTPANPQGTVADRSYLRGLVALARRENFVLAIDACYSDIYGDQPPPGVFEVCADDPAGLANVLAFHSLSKRSNVPGLRSGFIAGDARLMAAYGRLRSYSGGASPLPVLAAATALWSDEAHVEESRILYRHKFDLAERILGNRFGCYRPPGGFYLWLDVGDDEAWTRRLWQEAGIKAMPGSYLANIDQDRHNPGSSYIRLALVDDIETTRTALTRLANLTD